MSLSPTHVIARVFKSAFGAAVYARLAFLGPGRLDWLRGWIYAASLSTWRLLAV